MLLSSSTVGAGVRRAMRPGLSPVSATPNVNRLPAPGGSLQPNPSGPTDMGGQGISPSALPVPAVKGAGVTAIDPTNDLRNKAITPTNDVNRYDLVNQRLKNYEATQLPQYQANVRGIVQNNAAMGRVGSGMLNTSLGNEALAAENARNAYFGDLLTNATEGTITDAANNRAELRGERGYQNALEDQAYSRARQQRLDQEDILNSQFARGATRANVAGGLQGQADNSAGSFLDALYGRGAQAPTPQPSGTFSGALPEMSPGYPVSQIPSGVSPVSIPAPQVAQLPKNQRFSAIY